MDDINKRKKNTSISYMMPEKLLVSQHAYVTQRPETLLPMTSKLQKIIEKRRKEMLLDAVHLRDHLLDRRSQLPKSGGHLPSSCADS